MVSDLQTNVRVRRYRKSSLTTSICCFGLIASTSPALAYLDSSTGSLLLQIGLGIVAGIVVMAYMYRKDIANLIRRILPGD